jgi:hypothetical protein
LTTIGPLGFFGTTFESAGVVAHQEQKRDITGFDFVRGTERANDFVATFRVLEIVQTFC